MYSQQYLKGQAAQQAAVEEEAVQQAAVEEEAAQQAAPLVFWIALLI